jgi:perosamine synthetase
MHLDTSELIAAIRRALPPGTGDVGLHEPEFLGHESRYLQDCIDTGWVSYLGKYVDQFEQQLAARCGRKHAFAAVNGTAALHAALVVLGVEHGDEVILPSVTFVASANSIVQAGAVPHLIDCEPRTLGLDIARLRDHLRAIAVRNNNATTNRLTGRRLAAIVPVHVFGQPIDHDALDEVAREFDLPVLADATESLGSTWRGRPAGSYGLLSVLSFNGNKIVTTGGGGAILSRDPEVGKRIRYLTTTAKQPHPWEFIHDEVAWNFRLPNLNAAMGCAGLERLPEMLDAKRRLQARYEQVFANMAGVSVFREAEGCRSNYWLSALLLDSPDLALRDAILEACQDAGLMARACWRLNHHLPMYRDNPRMPLDVAGRLQPRIINLPSSPFLATPG